MPHGLIILRQHHIIFCGTCHISISLGWADLTYCSSIIHRARELNIVNQTLLVDALIQMLQVHSYTLQVHTLGFIYFLHD